MQKDILLARLHDKTAVIGIVGLGYMGLPLLLCFAQAGYKVIGFDIDQNKLNSLKAGKSYIEHIDSKLIAQFIDKQFIVTHEFSKASEADALILCVPTPLNEYREPDLQFIQNTMHSILPYLRKGQVISLESTSYPGTTEEEIQCPIESQGLKVGEDIFVVYSPEREDPANQHYTTATIPKICGGSTAACLEAGLALYKKVIQQVIPVSSLKTAEMAKLLENIHRAVNIGLVNEMKIVADKMDIDIHEVIEAAKTKPFGFVPYYPGPGIGGHCIPVDPFYLTWKARQYGLHTRFIELAGEINNAMPNYVIDKVIDGLNNHHKPLKNSKILILGLTYKKNVDDLRESPALTILSLLLEKGAKVEYCDPHIPIFPKMRDYYFDMQSLTIDASTLQYFDCVVLITDHDIFDYALIKQNAKLIVDTRGVYRGYSEHIIKA